MAFPRSSTGRLIPSDDIPGALGAEQPLDIALAGYRIGRNIQLLNQLDIVFAEIAGGRLVNLPHPQENSPKPRIFGARMGYRPAISFTRDVRKDIIRERLEITDIAVSGPKCRPFDFCEILEPTNSDGAYRFVLQVHDDVGALEIVAIIGLIGRKDRI